MKEGKLAISNTHKKTHAYTLGSYDKDAGRQRLVQEVKNC